MKLFKKILISKYFQPLMNLVVVVETAIIAVIGWINPFSSESYIYNAIYFILMMMVLFMIGLLIYSNVKNDRNNKIISVLCELQNNYLMSPDFKTAQQHANASKEKDLAEGGIAKILTNSLTYDMSCSKEIATNIIKGARYVYILPSTNVVIRSLENYIEKISPELGDPVNGVGLLKDRIEFWFFDESIICLYNFATLRQTSINQNKAFDQAWWYINPSDNTPDSYMLTKEISNVSDRDKLDQIFDVLEKKSFKCSGKDIFDNLEDLTNYIRK